jgi:hypothetical protein
MAFSNIKCLRSVDSVGVILNLFLVFEVSISITFPRLASRASAKIFGALLAYRLVISGLVWRSWSCTSEIYRMY